MWNVKRVLMLVGGLLACAVLFAVYALLLGQIDAMPVLPIELTYARDDGTLPPEPPEADRRLAQAYGDNCNELNWPLRLWLADKKVAFAAGDFLIDPKDGRVKLAPFSAAFFHNSQSPRAYPEISTIRCDLAILTLDRPVSSYAELGNRKVIGVELIGRQPDISLTNNRGTPGKNDDIDIRITNGNLIYAEKDNIIRTDGVVCVKDYQTQPPTVIYGKGLEMHMAKESSPNRPRPTAKIQTSTQTTENGSIEKIILYSDVDMHFWVDAKAGFMGGEPTEKFKAPAPGKAHIHIKTGGRFVYDLVKETASFESPVRDSGAPRPEIGTLNDRVEVVRLQSGTGSEKVDQLICDRLDLQFRKRAGPEGGDKEIETARATRWGKNDIILALDSEGMAAFGNEMFYRAGDASKGPETILKGEPLKSFKSGHKMVSKDLHLIGANRAGDGQKAVAQGPGQIDLLDEKSVKKDDYTTHVFWDNLLEVNRVKQGTETFDILTVRGNGAFIDDPQKQEMHADTITVWLRQLQESTKRAEVSGGPRQELQKVIASKRVFASSPEFIIRQADEFTATFVQKPAPSQRLPEIKMVAARTDPKDRIPAAAPPPPKVEQKKVVVEQKKKPEPPIELTGNTITAEIFTFGDKKELQELVAKGSVYVFQPGDKPGEKRIDITGQLLTVKYQNTGHELVVHGDQKNLARLELGELIMWGPLVTIDRGQNTAKVAGHGAMQMPSNKNLDGTDMPKDKKAGRITVYWNKRMSFDGLLAQFYGGVQGFQQDSYSKMTCENLSCYLDKFVSFKDGPNENKNAKLNKIICDKNVFIDDSQVDLKKQLLQRNILEGALLNNLEGDTRVTGPGAVKFLAMSNANAGAAPQPLSADNKPAPAKMVWKLTHVKFTDSMSAPKADGNNRKAFFYGASSGVEVFHFPTTDINATMNADRPGPDSLYLRCGMLNVEGRQNGERTTQTMKAQQNVEFRTDKYLGYADMLTYNEETDIVTLEGVNGNQVRLYEFVPGGVPRETGVRSTKVLYNRKSGTFESAGVKSISN